MEFQQFQCGQFQCGQFQKVMVETFEGFKGVESQIYDIVVHGRNQEIDGSRLHQNYFLNGLEKASDTLTRMIMKESISKQATHSDENETEAFA